jgi:hypothetical protein
MMRWPGRMAPGSGAGPLTGQPGFVGAMRGDAGGSAFDDVVLGAAFFADVLGADLVAAGFRAETESRRDESGRVLPESLPDCAAALPTMEANRTDSTAPRIAGGRFEPQRQNDIGIHFTRAG